MQAAAIALAVGSRFLEGQAAKQQAKADIAAQQAQAAASQFNAKRAQEQAAVEKSNSEAEAAKADRERRIRAGANIAAAGAGGTLSGNYLDIAMDNAAQEELNILTIQRQGLLAERGYLQQAGLEQSRATQATNAIPGIRKGAALTSAAGILSGGSNLMKQFA